MSKSANIFTRVDPYIKEQAEMILAKLGISMYTAMGMFLNQVVLQKGIPFDVKIPSDEPINIDNLSKEEIDLLMRKAIKSYENGECINYEDFKEKIKKELGI